MPWYRPQFIALVALGGAIGSLLRFGVFQLFPADRTFLATFAVNLIGSFVLGMLLEYLAGHRPKSLRSEQMRLLVGTGICGGFTTYSTFALDLRNFYSSFVEAPSLSLALVYVLGSLVLGMVAAVLGVWAGGRWAG
jgi:fluoride exporter